MPCGRICGKKDFRERTSSRCDVSDESYEPAIFFPRQEGSAPSQLLTDAPAVVHGMIGNEFCHRPYHNKKVSIGGDTNPTYYETDSKSARFSAEVARKVSEKHTILAQGVLKTHKMKTGVLPPESVQPIPVDPLLERMNRYGFPVRQVRFYLNLV